MTYRRTYRRRNGRTYRRRRPYYRPRRVYRRRAPRRSRASTMGSVAKKAFASEISGAVGRNLGMQLGSAIGGGIGSLAGPVGSAVGSGLGALGGRAASYFLNSIMGHGDYKTTYNTLVSADAVPQFSSGKWREIAISHREFIQDVVSSGTTGAFKIETFPINPAMPETFPWLAGVAQNFEEYQIHGMVFEFKSTTSNFSTTQNLGTVVMATQYNSLSPVFTNKQEMENYQFGVSTNPSCNLMHAVECETFLNPVHTLYVRSGPVTTGDLRLYDLGKFSIASVGLPAANTTIGELWVTYQIKMLVPKLGDSASVADHYIISNLAAVGASTPFGAANGNPLVATNTSDFGTVVQGNTIDIPEWFSGNIMVDYSAIINGGTLPVIGYVMTPSGGASELDILDGDTTYYYQIPPATGITGANFMRATGYFRCVLGGRITFTGVDWGDGLPPSTVDLIVSSIPSTLLN